MINEARLTLALEQVECSLVKQYPAQKVSLVVLLNSDSMEASPLVKAIEPLVLN